MSCWPLASAYCARPGVVWDFLDLTLRELNCPQIRYRFVTILGIFGHDRAVNLWRNRPTVREFDPYPGRSHRLNARMNLWANDPILVCHPIRICESHDLSKKVRDFPANLPSQKRQKRQNRENRKSP